MIHKINLFLSAFLRFIRRKPIVAAVVAVVLGAVAATAVTLAAIKHFKAKDNETMFSSSDASSAVTVSAEESEELPPPEEVPEVVQPIKKEISYKGKNIRVAAVEVAKPASKEDNKNGAYTAEKPQNAATLVSGVTISSCKAPGENYLYGIDVSSHNKSIDWAQVKKSGVQFAMIRCGYRGYLTGKIVMDACFEYNIENAYKNGIPVGVYFYSTAVNETEAIEEAAYVVELIKEKSAKGIKISYPIAYDFEEFYNTDNRSRAKTLSKAQISANSAAFLDFIKSSGYKPMLYAGKNPMKSFFETSLTSKYNFWLANYANATEYEGKFFMWQFTSSGSVGGIGGSVDLNICGFENNDNLQRFSVCKKEGVPAFSKPNAASGVVMTLSSNQIYLYRNTYNGNFKELKIDGKYCYVASTDLEKPFAATGHKYKTSVPLQVYKSPIEENSYKLDLVIPENTDLSVRGVWGNAWAEIEYGGKVCYIKADSLIITDESGSDSNSEPTSSESSGDDSSTVTTETTDN